jgi:hypothetical protein
MLTIESQPAAAARPANGPRRGELVKPRLPNVVWLNGRGYMSDSDLKDYEADLKAHALGVPPVYPPRPDPDHLVPLKAVAARLGVGRRTIGRRIKEAQDADAKEAAAALAGADAA